MNASDVEVVNKFGETNATVDDFLDYSRIISPLKENVFYDVFSRYEEDEIKQKLVLDGIKGVWENDDGDFCFYHIYMNYTLSESTNEQGEIQIEDTKFFIRFLEMSVVCEGTNIRLETSNYLGEDDELIIIDDSLEEV